MWLRPLTCRTIDGQRIVLVAPNRWLKEWFEDNYQDVVLEALRAQTAIDYEIVFEFAEPEPVVTPPGISPGHNPQAEAESDSSPRAHKTPGDLLGRYTFDAFVVGPSNQLAHAASRACAEVPAGKYNPLFIYGGVGLGKTHLVHAIGHRIREKHPGWRILYLKAESYMNEYINCVRNGKIDEFRKKYREKCDVLLMDDIQFLAGKDRTQDEFFHTFNSLFESHKQIILTADKYPHEIPDLEDRLRSRFQSGLIADIQTPELETRIAILKKKAELDQIDLPDDVAIFLATHIKSNVRELEGLLIRVAAFAGLQNQPITVEFSRETLKNFLSQSSHALTVEAVQKEVAAYFNVKLSDLKSPKRHQAIARPRQIAMYLARKLCKVSYPELGQRFGGKDHTTVLSAFRKIEGLVQTDPKTRHTVDELERHLAH
jgi:chromosomal replication initiator protein